MVNVLPPRVSIADQLGVSLGQGLQQGLQTQFQRGLIQNALEQAKKEIFQQPEYKFDKQTNQPMKDAMGRLISIQDGKEVPIDPSQQYLSKVFAIMKATAGIPGSERYLGQLFDILQRQESARTISGGDPRINVEPEPPPQQDQSQNIDQTVNPFSNQKVDTSAPNLPPPATQQQFLKRFASSAPQAGLEKALEEQPVAPIGLPKISYSTPGTGFYRRSMTKPQIEQYFTTRRALGITDDQIQNELNVKNASDATELEKSLQARGLNLDDQDLFINLAATNFPNVQSAEEAIRKTMPLYTKTKDFFSQVDELYKPTSSQSLLELIQSKGMGIASALVSPVSAALDFLLGATKDDKKEGPTVGKVLNGETSYINLLNKLQLMAKQVKGTPYESMFRQKVSGMLNGVPLGEKAPETTTTSWDMEYVFNPLSKKAQAKLAVHIPKNLGKMSDEEQINAVSDYLSKYASQDDNIILIRQAFVDKGADWNNFFEGFNKAQTQKKPYILGRQNIGNIATISNPPRNTLLSSFQKGEVTPIVRGQK